MFLISTKTNQLLKRDFRGDYTVNELDELLINIGWLLTKYITLPGLIVCVLLLFIYL